MVFEYERTERRLTLRRPGTRWLSSGFDGGYSRADAAHNLTVPEGFDRTDLGVYVDERLASVGADSPETGDRTRRDSARRDRAPTLLTGVHQRHARAACLDSVEVVATAGVSNPAALPVGRPPVDDAPADDATTDDREPWRPGTVNLFVGTSRALDDGALAGLFATAVEAKAATLLALAGVPGTTSDAVVVGCDPAGEHASFAGSATDVGAATRACVRETIRLSLQSRYGDDSPPSFERAPYGVRTTRRPQTFEP